LFRLEDWSSINNCLSRECNRGNCNIVMDRRELLNQSFQQFEQALSGNGNFKINQKIEYKTRRLKYEYGLNDDEILNRLFDEFLEKHIYKKITPEKTLSTFIIHATNYGLNIELRKQQQEKRNYPSVSLDALAEESSDGYCGSAISFLEIVGTDSLVDHTTPEDLVIAKELMELIIDHFGEHDAEVLLGYSDRITEANRLSISYDTYCKRLSRKIHSFMPVLQVAGYC